MKKNKAEREAIKESQIENEVATDLATETSTEGSVTEEVEIENTPSKPTVVLQVPAKKKPGRPADLEKVKARLLKKASTGGKKGRPVVEGSKRQERIAQMTERKAANGGAVQLGRPKMDPTLLAERRAARKIEKAQEELAIAEQLRAEGLIK